MLIFVSSLGTLLIQDKFKLTSRLEFFGPLGDIVMDSKSTQSMACGYDSREIFISHTLLSID